MTVEELARLVDPEARKLRHAGQGRLQVRCVAHEDERPSLSVWIDDKGKAAFNCHAGCSHEAIIAALPPEAKAQVEATFGKPDNVRILVPTRRHTPAVHDEPAAQVEGEYPYTDHNGAVQYVVRRFPGKKIRQFHLGPSGGLVKGRGDSDLYPYRLTDVIEARDAGDLIYVVEGEKDADNLASHGLTATCNVGGAGKWTETLNPWFKDARIVILPDNDQPGQAHAEDVLKQLSGVASEARILTLPDLPDKGDVTDWLETHTPEELEQFAHQTVEEPDSRVPKPIDIYALMTGDAPEEEWMAEPILPARKLVGIVSRRGEGKSLLTLDIAANKAAGQPTLEQRADPPIDVVYLDMEMGPEDLYDRLYSLGWHADNPAFPTLVEHLHYYQLITLPPLDTEDGGRALEELVEDHNAQLVVVDTVSRVISGDENAAEPFRDLFRHTETRLKRRGVTLLRLDHLGKDADRGSRGSSAKEDPLDIVWHINQTVADTLQLQLTKGRQDWVTRNVTIKKETVNGVLTHRVPEQFAPDWLLDLVSDIDSLGVDETAGYPTVSKALQKAGKGRRATDIRKAIRFRKGRVKGGPETGPGPDHPPRTTSGTTPDHPDKNIQLPGITAGTTPRTTPDHGKGGPPPTRGGTTPDKNDLPVPF